MAIREVVEMVARGRPVAAPDSAAEKLAVVAVAYLLAVVEMVVESQLVVEKLREVVVAQVKVLEV